MTILQILPLAILRILSSLIRISTKKFSFDGVGLATNLWSSLAPCHFDNGRSLQTKNLRRLLVKF